MPPVLAAVALPGWLDPEDVYCGGPAQAEHGFWLDAGPGAAAGWSLVGTGAPGAGPRVTPCEVCASAPESAAGSAAVPGPFPGGWIGWLGYDAAASRGGAPAADDASLPAELWLEVDRFVVFDHAARRTWAVAPPAHVDAFADEVRAWAESPASSPPPAAPLSARARHSAPEYAELIARCRDAIREGEAYQLCLSTRFEVGDAREIDAVAAFRRLRRLTPAHHAGLIRSGDVALVSASPERFLRIDGGVVRTHPIKGTRPRGVDPESDAALAAELAASPKERAENVMIVDLMRNDLQQVCAPGTVAVERLLEVESYRSVHQLVSTVAGRLRPGATVGDVLAATFPAGSMTGAPKLSAMSILHRLEGAPRGVFAGCFGWVGTDGTADLAMVIRSIAVSGTRAYVGAGGGITWHSDAAAEVREVSVKARAPLQALGASLPSGW